MRILLTLLFSLWIPAFAASPMPTPEMLLQKAALGQSELRDALFDIEINLPEMRDVQTFDSYFLMMDKLQSLAKESNLDALYPDAVPRLAGRMVEKGVNWLDPVTSSKETILYYHRWMTDPRPAFNFLDITELRLKRETSPAERKIVADRLTDLLIYAETRWPLETALRVTYRNALSELAVSELRNSVLGEDDIKYWLLHIYTEDAISEIITVLLDQTYSLKASGSAGFSILTARISALEIKLQDPYFAASESLKSQLSEATEQVIERGMRYGFNLSGPAFTSAMRLMFPHHLVSLAKAWPQGASLENAMILVGELSSRGLEDEASPALAQVNKPKPVVEDDVDEDMPDNIPIPTKAPPRPLIGKTPVSPLKRDTNIEPKKNLKKKETSLSETEEMPYELPGIQTYPIIGKTQPARSKSVAHVTDGTSKPLCRVQSDRGWGVADLRCRP